MKPGHRVEFRPLASIYTTFAGIEPSLRQDELVATLTEVWMRAIYGSGEAHPPL